MDVILAISTYYILALEISAARFQAQLGGNWYASTKKYLSACNRDGLLPSTDPFVTGHSDCIKAKSQGLGDRDVFAICEMLEMGSPVRELDLENNPGVTEKAGGLEEIKGLLI